MWVVVRKGYSFNRIFKINPEFRQIYRDFIWLISFKFLFCLVSDMIIRTSAYIFSPGSQASDVHINLSRLEDTVDYSTKRNILKRIV